MKKLKLILVNFAVLIGLLLCVELGANVLFLVRGASTGDEASQAKLATGPNVTKEVLGFREETKTIGSYPYKAFLGWTSPDLSGEYLNVKNGFRVTTLPADVSLNQTLHFFGGSTMWGHSVSDKNTIPSLVATNLNQKTLNYGEQAYNSRQSLNRLVDSLTKIDADDVVVFYDGVNDVYHNCRSYNSSNGHAREFFIRQVMSHKNDLSGLLTAMIEKTATFRLLRGLSARMRSDGAEQKPYKNSCEDPVYAEAVADFLVANWSAAEAMVASKGADFMCALQPTPYTLNGQPAYIDKEMRDQINAVYPLIHKKAQKLNCYRDLTGIFVSNHYVDSCCHLNADGNAVIAEYFSSEIKQKGLMNYLKR